MGVHVIKMPDIGEGIAEVELVAWRVQPGDAIVEDQILADVMTDKATVEIPSPVVGTVLALGGEVGQQMAVGSELIRIEVAGEEKPRRPPAKPAEPKEASAPPPAKVAALQAPAPARASVKAAERPIASPAVRRRAWEAGVDLQQVQGSGLGGRIMQADLDAHVAKHGVGTPPAPRPAAAAASPPLPRYAERNEEEQIRITGLRRKIAQKMQEAKRHIPHFTYVEEVDVTELEALRAKLNARWSAQRGKLTLLPMLMRALVLAVRDFPQMNARFDDETGIVTRHGAVHIGIATQTTNGLMVPVVRHAETLDLWGCAAEVLRLADASRAGKATRDELSGSTITITSLGPLGGIVTTPVINHPEVAIVGINRIVERPVIRAGAVVPRLLMNLSSSFDHRVVDGQDAAEFVQAIRTMLETPSLLFIN